MQMAIAQVQMPANRDWNHSPRSGPISIAMRVVSRSVITVEISMLVSPEMMPDALPTTLWAASNTPMTMFQVFVTISTAAADLKAHLKNIQVSTSFRLFLSVMSWISSRVITKARIAPAIGTITELDRFWIMPKTLAFHAWGVMATCPAISPTFWLVASNSPVRLLMTPLTSISFSHSVILSHRKSIGFPPVG